MFWNYAGAKKTFLIKTSLHRTKDIKIVHNGPCISFVNVKIYIFDIFFCPPSKIAD